MGDFLVDIVQDVLGFYLLALVVAQDGVGDAEDLADQDHSLAVGTVRRYEQLVAGAYCGPDRCFHPKGTAAWQQECGVGIGREL